MNGKHIDIRISDHRGQLNDNSRINTLNIYYNTPLMIFLKIRLNILLKHILKKINFKKFLDK